MQVHCKSTNGNAETHCCVCGQGFVMFWERQSRAARIEALREIQRTLRSHHRTQPGPQAHPQEAFAVPGSGDAVASPGAADSMACTDASLHSAA